MWRPEQNIHHRQLAGRVPLLPEQRHPDQVLVLRPDGHLFAVAAAAAGRAPVHQRRPVRAVAESAPSPFVVAGRWHRWCVPAHVLLPFAELRHNLQNTNNKRTNAESLDRPTGWVY
uniref:(northern house mosquito) hypothetical protein n=1 Tax=Culex pipiens TaxID=7175 RepID=A0A8D8B8E7_CULPI